MRSTIFLPLRRLLLSPLLMLARLARTPTLLIYQKAPSNTSPLWTKEWCRVSFFSTNILIKLSLMHLTSFYSHLEICLRIHSPYINDNDHHGNSLTSRPRFFLLVLRMPRHALSHGGLATPHSFAAQ